MLNNISGMLFTTPLVTSVDVDYLVIAGGGVVVLKVAAGLVGTEPVLAAVL